jgi:transcriptional regulator with XRE-family HTH domain
MFAILTPASRGATLTHMGTADIYPLIGEAIKSRRKHLSLTQDKLAAALQISRASLANIEAGRQKVLVHHLYDIADALQLDVKDLLVEMPKVSAPTEQDVPLPPGLDDRQKLQVLRVFSDSGSQAEELAAIDQTR